MKRITSILFVTVLTGAASCFADTPARTSVPRYPESRPATVRTVSDSFNGNSPSAMNHQFQAERQVQISKPRRAPTSYSGFAREQMPVWRGQASVPAPPHYQPAPPPAPHYRPAPPAPAPVSPSPPKPSLIGFILSIL